MQLNVELIFSAVRFCSLALMQWLENAAGRFRARGCKRPEVLLRTTWNEFPGSSEQEEDLHCIQDVYKTMINKQKRSIHSSRLGRVWSGGSSGLYQNRCVSNINLMLLMRRRRLYKNMWSILDQIHQMSDPLQSERSDMRRISAFLVLLSR